MGSAQSHHCELEGGDDSPVCCLLVTLSFSRVFISWPPLFAFCSVSKWLRVNSSRSSRHAGMPWAVQTAPDLFASSVSTRAARPAWQQRGAGGAVLRARAFFPHMWAGAHRVIFNGGWSHKENEFGLCFKTAASAARGAVEVLRKARAHNTLPSAFLRCRGN